MYHSFRPGKFWYDTDGNLIQAHGGSVLYVDGIYYWYGENKTGITGRATGEPCPYWHKGVQLYSSTDLYNWKNEGTIAIEYEDKNSPFYIGRIMDRPHILYNERTKKYVMWAKIAGLLEKLEGFTETYFAVAESESIKGPYKEVARLTDYYAGDFDLFKDNDKAYVVFGKPFTEVLCIALNEDYTNYTENSSSHIPTPCPPFAREAPAYFKRGDKRFLLTSGTTGYFPNITLGYDITDLHGEWKELGDVCVGDIKHNSFHAQFSSVFKHPNIDDLYIALGDRWLNDMPEEMPSPDDMFESFFVEEKKKEKDPYRLELYTDENTSMATYVWLPIRFTEEGIPYIVWENEWCIED